MTKKEKEPAKAVKPSVTIEQVRMNVQRDLACSVAFLNFIRNDPDFTEKIVEMAFHRMQNTKPTEKP